MKIIDFITRWNEKHPDFMFSCSFMPGTKKELPTRIEVRYGSSDYRYQYDEQRWKRLCNVTDIMSVGTMHIVSDRALFSEGIIDIAVGCQDYNYRPGQVMSVLNWIGSELFDEEDDE